MLSEYSRNARRPKSSSGQFGEFGFVGLCQRDLVLGAVSSGRDWVGERIAWDELQRLRDIVVVASDVVLPKILWRARAETNLSGLRLIGKIFIDGKTRLGRFSKLGWGSAFVRFLGHLMEFERSNVAGGVHGQEHQAAHQ